MGAIPDTSRQPATRHGQGLSRLVPRSLMQCLAVAIALGAPTALAGNARAAAFVLLNFDNMTATDKDTNADVLGPINAGYILFDKEKYENGVSFALSGPSFIPPDWATLGVRDFRFQFGGVSISSLSDLSWPPLGDIAEWQLSINVPALPAGGAFPSSFSFFVWVKRDVDEFLEFSLVPGSDMLTGQYSSETVSGCLGPFKPIYETPEFLNCSVSGSLTGPVTLVPEPGSLALLGVALLGLGALARRRPYACDKAMGSGAL